jgi:hypothetical protein
LGLGQVLAGERNYQGDQIERLFLILGRLFSSGSFWAVTETGQHFVTIFITEKVEYKISLKMDRDTFWAIFSQTHLVTLETVEACARAPFGHQSV